MRASVVLTIFLSLAFVPFPSGAALPFPTFDPVHPSPGSDPTCGTGAPVRATSGAGDAALPTLAYAALKTGYRAAIVWETEADLAASLTYSIDGGAAATLAEVASRKLHVFVLDELPTNATLCFTPSGAASAHAMRLSNAMYARDGGIYTVNLLVVANEQPVVDVVDDALDDYAETLWDATDGHVASGRVIALYGEPSVHNSGWASCYVALTAIPTPQLPTCHRYADVLFTNDAFAGGAASTYKDGIHEPDQAIWMNAYFQSGYAALDDPGSVLTHEMGHYAFGAMDLYAGDDCWVPALGLSVMGGEREATEFDDEVNRCPNEAQIADYVPTWTLLRERFPAIPERTVVDLGPVGAGPSHARHSYIGLPQLFELPSELALVEQDDAGTGADAGGLDEPAPVSPGIVYSGTLPPGDASDAYVFDAHAGSVVEIAVYPAGLCFTPYDANGAEIEDDCSTDGVATTSRFVAPGGPLRFELSLFNPVAYRFGIGVDAAAPLPV